MECTFCGMPLKASDPRLVWSEGETRDPFCDAGCERAEATAWLLAHVGNRRRRLGPDNS